MRVLLISSNYAPETAGIAPYSAGLAEGLTERGHEVTVVAGFPHYPSWRTSGRALARNEQRNGVAVRRRLHYVPRSPTLVKRGVYELSLCLSGSAGLPRSRPDVIVGVVPSLADAAVARLASTIYRRPYGLLFQDLIAPAIAQANGRHGVGVAVARIERSLLSAAARTAIVAEGFRGYLEQAGADPARIHRVRNWAEYSTSSTPRQQLRRELGWAEDEIVCLYAGSLGAKQGLDVILRAALLLKRTKVRIVLAGDGGARRRLQEEASRIGAPVSFLPPSPSGEYEARLEAADILLLTQLDAVAEMCLASKIGPYLMAARPIVAAVATDSETGRELARTGAGVLLPPERPAALAASIRDLMKDPQHREVLGRAGRRYAVQTLSRGAAITEYEAFLNALLTSSGTEGATA